LQQIFSVNYELALFYKMRIYSVFHVSLLELVVQEILMNNIAEVKNNELEYEVEKILKHRSIDNTKEYFIK
ncbi:hypothetical protein M406DRAFT_235052, partial [Cryphonectria parasitica EP155]